MAALTVDTRERAVIPFIQIPHKIEQVSVGDYLISSADGQVLACIERKELSDYGASIRDGRKSENFEKMFGLRHENPHMQLYLILEGDLTPNDETVFGGIKYKNILTSATNLMVERGVFMIQTTSKQHTAKRLADLVRSFASRRNEVKTDLAADVESIKAIQEKYIEGSGASSRFTRTDIQEAVLVLSGVNGISAESAKSLLSEYTLSELFNDPNLISGLRQASGRKYRTSIINELAIIKDSKELTAKLLSRITGITEKMIDRPLVGILNGENIDILGKIRQSKIVKILNTKYNIKDVNDNNQPEIKQCDNQPIN